MPDIRITVDGRPALTTAQAAARHGRVASQVRDIFSARRYDLAPVAMLDPRTPLYDVEAVDALLGNMPGRGHRTDLHPPESALPEGADR